MAGKYGFKEQFFCYTNTMMQSLKKMVCCYYFFFQAIKFLYAAASKSEFSSSGFDSWILMIHPPS